MAALLPIVCAGIAKYGAMRIAPGKGGYDNNDPRAWLARQTDWRARANASQANTFEAIPFFFAAVIIAHQFQASQALLDVLAVVFVVLRVVYIALYVGNKANARSIVWALAFFINIGILFSGFR
ncbi:putative MAPEG superfamily protein [Polaromonas sp. CG_9.11]|nr:putative MAPEG superfamily protein [Polaromonas sp. CG_9.11]